MSRRKPVGRSLSAVVWVLLLAALFTLLPACAGEANPPPTSGEPVVIEVYSSSTKEDWMNAVADMFNGEQVRTASGRPIAVEMFHVSSGGSMNSILEGDIQPAAWSPGELSWVESANLAWQAPDGPGKGKPLVSEFCRPTIYEPTGIALWRPMAEAMGWPERSIGWAEIVALAADPQGWARYGHPEWGRFKLGLTNPETSNSGRLFLTGLIYDTLGISEGLTPEMVRAEPVRDVLRQINLYTAEFGTQSALLLERMVAGGPDVLHAINTNEAETLKSNARYGRLLPFPLVFIVPGGGTLWGEHPFCIVDAEWVSDEQREGARLFAAYLLEPEQQMLAVERGLRPANSSIELGPPITVENGANPQAVPLTAPALESPSAETAQAIRELFVEIKDELAAGQGAPDS